MSPAEPFFSSHINNVLSSRVAAFQSWVHLHQFPTNLVDVFVSDEFRVGVIAKQKITQKEVYLRVPPHVIMDTTSARNCVVLGPIFTELVATIGSDPEFELILHLMYETYVKRTLSFYAPCIQLLPSLSEMHPAYLYTEDTLQELVCMDLYIVIEKKQIEKSNMEEISRCFFTVAL